MQQMQESHEGYMCCEKVLDRTCDVCVTNRWKSEVGGSEDTQVGQGDERATINELKE